VIDLYVGVIINGLLIGAVYALIATGLNLIFGTMRVVNFAHGEFVVIGMYVGYGAWKLCGLPPALSVPIATVLMFGLGYAFQRAIGNKFVDRPQHVQFVLFISLALIITGLNASIFGPDPRAIESAASFDVYKLGKLRIDAARLHAAAGALAIVVMLWAWLRFSLTGKALQAASQNLLGGRAIGIHVEHVFAITMGIGAACAGTSGALIAPLFDATPYLAGDFTLVAFIIVIVGGMGSLPGAFLGGLLIGASEALAAVLMEPSAKSIISYALLVAVILLRPAGLLGEKAR
jgi:branched-chain amino acid transport system permease protein